MKRTLEGIVVVGEPLIRQAIEATRAYHRAEADGRPAKEVERLRVLADFLYQAVMDYQLRAINGHSKH